MRSPTARRLEGRSALVTGGAQGIGSAVCERLASEGATVVVADVNGEKAAELACRLGMQALHLQLDVTDRDSVESAVSCMVEKFSNLDILVNAAGVTAPTVPAWELTDEDWHRVMAVNLYGVFLTCTAVVPVMRASGYGRIVNVASLAGVEGKPRSAAYSAAKAGVIAFTRSLGKELAEDGVIVNAVVPTAVETPMFHSMTADARRYMLERIPMRRPGRPEELAALITWMSSDECSFTTGASFDFSGGRG